MAELVADARIGALIPARLGSERLPDKQLADLGGMPVIVRMIERLSSSGFLERDRIVVCTTERAQDDRLATCAEGAGASVFRGHPDDLVDRLGSAVAEHELDIALEVDGDDPFVDVAYGDRAIERLLERPDVDVVTCPELPLGLASKAVRASAFRTVLASYRTTRNDTGFMYFFTRSGLCDVDALQASDPRDIRPDIRLTLDYEEDLVLMREVFDCLGPDPAAFGVREIVELFERRPELKEINGDVSEEYWRRSDALVSLEFVVGGERKVIRGT